MKRSVFSVHSKGALSVHLVPYSEHSSYPELLEYVKWLRPRQVRCGAQGLRRSAPQGLRGRSAAGCKAYVCVRRWRWDVRLWFSLRVGL